MQFKLLFASIALLATTVLSTTVEDKCGALGVTDVDISILPTEVDPNNIRECKEHPAALSLNPVSKRSCWYGANIGCQAGYCWRRCVALVDPIVGGILDPLLDLSGGGWCWMAENRGYGNWLTCNSDSDCTGALTALTTGCGQGDCYACGCGC